MSAKKWLTIITLLCVIISLVAAVVIGNKPDHIGYDIALSVFASAILGFIMSLTEYFTERRNAMELFWQEARKTLKKLRKVKYISTAEPYELVVACLCEEQHNEWAEPLIRNGINIQGMEISHEKKDELLNWLKTHRNIPADIFTNNEARDALYEDTLSEYREKFETCIDEYIQASKIDIGALDNAYGNLDFLIGSKRVRSEAYDGVFDALRIARAEIAVAAYHFNAYRDGNGNFLICVEYIADLNSEFFTTETVQQGEIVSITVYQELFDEIEDKIEDFRLKIYYKKQKKQHENTKHLPVSSIARAVRYDTKDCCKNYLEEATNANI